MPDLVEQMYCSQQIFIPPNLPSILKKYAKAAIRTQPGDLLSWSSAYFRALADGIPPPAKDRIEYPPVDTPSGLSPGFLKVLINQIGKRETVRKDVLAERWKGVCLNAKALQDLLDVGMFEDDVSWLEFLAICVGTLEPSLTRTMVELCELLTDEPEGGRAAIPVTIFLNLYKYLAKLDCGPVNRLEDYEKALKADSETQCQATDLKPTEEEKEPQEANIDWDTAIEGETKADESGGDDPDEGIVVEAAEIENDKNGNKSLLEEDAAKLKDEVPTDPGDPVDEAADATSSGKEEDEETGEQEEEANTERKSPELVETESEENGEANEEEVTKIEVVDDAQSGNAFEDVGLEDTEVSKESEEGDVDGLNVDKQTEESETQKDESANIKVDENDETTTEDEKKEEPDNQKAEDGVNEADYMDNGESTGGAKEEADEDAVSNRNESLLEEDAAKLKDEVPTDPGDPDDEAADVTSSGKEEDDGKDDAEAVTAGVSQLEGVTDEPAGVDEGQGEVGNNESDGQTADETEKDVTDTPAIEGEGAKSDEANVDVENGDMSDEPPEAIDDTKDIKVGSTTSEEISVEPTDSPVEDDNKGETEEADKGIEAPTTPEIDESAPGANKELAEGVQDEETALAGDMDQENLIEAPNGDDTNNKSGAEIDIANVTSPDEASQDQAEIDSAENGEIEKDADPSVNQGETEELAADETKDQEESGAADDQQDVVTAGAGSEETSVDGEIEKDADPSVNQGETEELAADETKDQEESGAADDQQDVVTAGAGSEETSVDGEIEKDADPSVNQGETEELAADETKDQEESGAADDQQDVVTAGAGSEETSVDGEIEKDADPSVNQGETEELAADETKDQEESGAADDQQDVVTAGAGSEETSVDGEIEKDADPSVNQGETEELAADETKDQEESGAADDQQDAVNETAGAGSEETSVDGNELENTQSAADVIPEEGATAETSSTENVKQTAEDENGNKPLQDKSIQSVEETIDPKSASPRAESVLDEDALKERDSDISVYTKQSDDGMMVWPDIKPQEKEEADPELLLEKEVTSEDGIEVFTDIEMQPHQEELKLLTEQQEEEVEAEQEENIFAPQIDSFTDLLEAESAPVEETNPEELAAALESTELGTEESGVRVTSGMMAMETAESDEAASQGPAESATLPSTEVKAEEQDQKKEKKPRRQKKDVEIDTLVKKDSDMMLLPTPITSDVMLYMDGACDKTAVKLSQTQQLHHKMSMIDVQVSVPVDKTIVEVVEYHRYPKWMHIPGIGPTVPDHIIEEAEQYFLKISELQEGMVMPRNIKHFHCPPLELIADCPEEL